MRWYGKVGLEMVPHDAGKVWHTSGLLTYVSDEDGPGEGVAIQISSGLPTDGASIPRLFWMLIGCPLRGRYAPAAVMHDGLYASRWFARDINDLLFREMLMDLDLGPTKTQLMYLAVRVFAGSAWKRHTTESIKAARRLVTIS